MLSQTQAEGAAVFCGGNQPEMWGGSLPRMSRVKGILSRSGMLLLLTEERLLFGACFV